MREAILHFIWQGQKFPAKELRTTLGLPISVQDTGRPNTLSGPDFLNAHIRIDKQQWVGHVELHVKASDWYVHQHQRDAAYENVILHVVWEADTVVTRKDGSNIPTLGLNEYIREEEMTKFRHLFFNKKQHSLLCEGDIGKIAATILSPWIDKLFQRRIAQKVECIQEWLLESGQDWEQVFFMALLKSYGLNINAASFLSLGKALNYSIIRKNAHNAFLLESMFFGMTGLLGADKISDPYYLQLKLAYKYLQTKYKLRDESVFKPEFFSLRPYNFPTLRLSQIANLYHRNPALFMAVVKATSLKSLRTLLQTNASTYWDTHYVFGKPTACNPKSISRQFTDLIILNAVLPIREAYHQNKGSSDLNFLTFVAQEMSAERNKIVRLFHANGVKATNAYQTQSLLELYHQYCLKNKCLHCAAGRHLLYGK
ncbi:DUF2851 family protein [Muriicola sp.]|uniref:DUF2851 family protein n=1 Tax=Muriicola sp. TaxID=2020856 RepID=UPI003C753237